MKNEEQNSLNVANVSHSPRFVIIEKSVSAHCCFAYTIVDTQAGKDFSGYWKHPMCETFDQKEAEIICEALNKHYH